MAQIGTTNMGVVVYVGRETLKVLTQSGVVQTVHPPELRGKRNLARWVRNANRSGWGGGGCCGMTLT